MKNLTLHEAYKWATARCARGEQCRHDIGEKLRERGLADAVCQQLLDRLEDENYINEERYARAYVHDKFRFDHWGRVKIQQALRLRRLPDKLVHQALEEEIDEEAYRDALTTLLNRKADSLAVPHTDMESRQLAQKLLRHAVSRG
ncbi:MAG: RecX family transcriptional regulator, partial [Bacteroidaceae bacterium]|nr:RecX family transcriptional regulator [Bacteroidaceae bacterium]